MITDIVMVALGAAFVVIFIDRIGWREEFIAKSPKLISEMFSCDFCLSWWICVLLVIGTALWRWDASILIVPFFSTPITRALL